MGGYLIGEQGKLTLINEVSAKGTGTCHVALDSHGRALIVANYVGGSVASYRVGTDGRLGDPVSFYQYSGYGPNKARQDRSHAHSNTVSPDDQLW